MTIARAPSTVSRTAGDRLPSGASIWVTSQDFTRRSCFRPSAYEEEPRGQGRCLRRRARARFALSPSPASLSVVPRHRLLPRSSAGRSADGAHLAGGPRRHAGASRTESVPLAFENAALATAHPRPELRVVVDHLAQSPAYCVIRQVVPCGRRVGRGPRRGSCRAVWPKLPGPARGRVMHRDASGSAR